MKLRWFIPVAILLPLRLSASAPVVAARVTTIVINPAEVTPVHLRPEFESVIRLPEEITSVVLGSPSLFKAEHSEGEPEYVYVKPITNEPAESNLLIGTKSGKHVTLALISEGAAPEGDPQPVDFLIEYRSSRSFLIASDSPSFSAVKPIRTIASSNPNFGPTGAGFDPAPASASALDEEFDQQAKVNAPEWTKWEGQQIETSIDDIRQWGNETVVAYSVLNASDRAVEIVPPQIQISGRKTGKKKKKEGNGIIADQLEIRDYRLSETRLEPGSRADGVVVFDRPNFKQSTEKLFLQIAQADQIDHPILIRLPFTPPIAADQPQKGTE